MKIIQLTQGKSTIVDDEDYELLMQFNWCAFNQRGKWYVGKRPTKYSPHRYMHRFLLELKDSKIHADHIDGDGLNNQKINLRICTHSQNSKNKSPSKTGTSKFLGVCFYKTTNRWHAQINDNKKVKHIGYFKNEIEAAKAYDLRAKQVFGEFAHLNFPI